MDFSFRNSLGPVAWALLALVPVAIFALYFLKLKRTPLEVPSTYLWHRVIEDLHVNSLWQRLRKSLLLLLQLLLVALAIAAVLRPGWQATELEGQRFIFLVDRSASMSARDQEGQTRLEAAKSQLAAMIDQMESDMSAMIIAYADRPDVVQEFTSNKRLLREAVARIKPSVESTSIRGALELAGGFANPGRVALEEGGTEFPLEEEPVELLILSDGRFGSVDGFSLGNLQPKYFPLGTATAENLAITALNTRRNEVRPDERQAFVQAANFSGEAQQAVVELWFDGTLIDAAELALPPGETASYTFPLGAVASGTLRATLRPPEGFVDALPLDNRAFAAIDEQRDVEVLLVTPGNVALEAAMTTERAQRLAAVEIRPPEDLEQDDLKRAIAAQRYDLVIYDQATPEEMPPANTLLIGRLPPLESWRVDSSSAPISGVQLIDWQRSHPLLNLVELGNVQMVDSWIVDPPAGGNVLIDSTKGGVFAIAPRDAYEDAVLGFEIVGRDEAGDVTINTNWPHSFGFPNFCLNVLEYLGGSEVSDPTASYRPGEPVELNLRENLDEVEVKLPDERTVRLEADANGRFAFHETDQPGIYVVYAQGRPVRRFAVNLLDREESDVALRERQDRDEDLAVVESLSIGYVDVEAERSRAPARRELWKWLLLAALVVLLVEWYIYNRRIYV